MIRLLRYLRRPLFTAPHDTRRPVANQSVVLSRQCALASRYPRRCMRLATLHARTRFHPSILRFCIVGRLIGAGSGEILRMQIRKREKSPKSNISHRSFRCYLHFAWNSLYAFFFLTILHLRKRLFSIVTHAASHKYS